MAVLCIAMRLFLFFGLAAGASGHGAVTIPKPRNAIDGGIAPWNGTVPSTATMPFMFWCAHPSADSADPRKVTGSNGQACFFFSNGCDISCEECDGQTGQVVHPRFNWTGHGPRPPWTGPGFVPTNVNKTGRRPDGSYRLSICEQPKRQATLCDPKHRTMNVDAPCRSDSDFTQFAPWRAPGASPVIDSCGVAGGVYDWQPAAAAGGDYQQTVNVKRGDLGSRLPKMPTGTNWAAGSEVEVAWTLKAWHGGGYQFRLCPADRDLNEDCFQSQPIAFASNASMLRWGGTGGNDNKCEPGKYENCHVSFEALDVSVGTLPEGSAWRKGPIPSAPWSRPATGASFPPVCQESDACTRAGSHADDGPHSRDEGAFPCECSGWGDGDLYRMEIVDKLRVPAVPAGDYVLGWRWDCEESTQVWASCSDITITN